MTDHIKIKYWWSEDKKWFCILTDDGVNQSTVSLTQEEASLLSMNALAPVAKAPAVSEADVGRLESELADCEGALDTIAAHRKDSRTQWGNERFYQGKVSALKFALSLIQSAAQGGGTEGGEG